jgi:hypothetical protein
MEIKIWIKWKQKTSVFALLNATFRHLDEVEANPEFQKDDFQNFKTSFKNWLNYRIKWTSL